MGLQADAVSLSLGDRIAEVPRPGLLCPISGASSQADTHTPIPSRRRNRRRRRTAAYGDDDAQPRVPTRLWFRLVELLVWRGEIHPCAHRAARHLTFYSSARGYLSDIETTVIPGYKARHDLGRRTFYADMDRLITAGLLRQTRAACPGRTVGYQMCVPTVLPADLPKSLGAELRRLWSLRPDEAEEQHRVPVDAGEAIRVRIPMVQRHQLLADCEAVRLGSCRSAPLDSQSSRGRLHTSPLLKRALSHPPKTPDDRPSVGRRSGLSGREIYNEEGLLAEVLAKCERIWRHDRGAAGGLADDARARLTPLISGALRYLASADVIEAMTAGTRTARDLGAVVATRLRGVIKSGRRARNLKVDEHAADRGRQEAADRAAQLFEQPAVVAARAAARAAAEAVQRAGRTRLEAARPRVAPPTTAAAPTRPAPAAAAIDQAPAELDPAEARALRWAMRNAAAAQASASNSTTVRFAG